MAATFLTKVSGVSQITQTTGFPKSYFGGTGKYQSNADGTGVVIQIGGDTFQISLTDLRVNGQTPATLSTALVLLNSFFGS